MTDGNIFISYRRGPDSNAAGRLHDRLERNFDQGQLFFDVDAIPLGVDFAEYIDAKVGECRVQLVLIGQGWLSMTDRLQNPDDFVRIEIEAALRRPDIPVIPVLLDGADMPTRDTLPESMHALVRRNAIVITHAQFAGIVDGRLTSELEGLMRAVASSSDVDKDEDVETSATQAVSKTQVPIDTPTPPEHIAPEKTGNKKTKPSETRMSPLWIVGSMVVLLLGVSLYQWGWKAAPQTESQQQESPAIIPLEEPIIINEAQPELVFFGQGQCLEVGASNHEWRLIGQTDSSKCQDACLKDQSCSGVTDAIAKNNSCVLHQKTLFGKRDVGDGSICFIKR
ncbi:MAG: toll/interleukin-1 receptor domain-containing protein [Aliishimia sp.]